MTMKSGKNPPPENHRDAAPNVVFGIKTRPPAKGGVWGTLRATQSRTGLLKMQRNGAAPSVGLGCTPTNSHPSVPSAFSSSGSSKSMSTGFKLSASSLYSHCVRVVVRATIKALPLSMMSITRLDQEFSTVLPLRTTGNQKRQASEVALHEFLFREQFPVRLVRAGLVQPAEIRHV